MIDISEETHEFRQGTTSCIYSTVLCLLPNVGPITKVRLRQLVKERINKNKELNKTNLSNDIDKNNKIVRKSCGQINKIKTTNNEDELEALASLCKMIFSVVFITKLDQVIVSVYVKYYGWNSLLVEQCVYMIHDGAYKHYAPLYLFKSDTDPLITVFDRKNNKTNNILLRKFFKEQLNYHELVELDDDMNIMTSEISPRVQNSSDNIPEIISLNTEQNPLKKQMIENEIEGNKCVIMSSSLIETGDTSNGDQLPPNVTYEFRRKDVPDDSSCLYWSFIRTFCKSKWMNVKRLRHEVADVIFDMDVDDGTLLADTGCQTRLEYCNQIRKNAWPGEFEVPALARKYNVVITIVNRSINEQNKLSINVINYGEDNQSCTKRVYIIYDTDNDHYEPLYSCDKNNPNNYKTIFDRCDTMVNTLLEDFIRKQYRHHELQKFGAAQIRYDYDISDKLMGGLNMPGNHQSLTRQTIITTDTHEFRIGELPGDDQCLFSSVIYLFDRSKTINIKSLRQNVANHIRQSKDINDISLSYSSHCQTREDYCLKIEEGTIGSGDLERYALAHLYPNILFCIISITKNQNAPSIQVDTYVEDISSYKKCIIIFYDTSANIYVPFYLYDKIRHEEANISFKYDDITKILLKEFIQKKLNYHGYINLDIDSIYDEVDSDVDVQSEFFDILKNIADNTTTDLPEISMFEKNESHDKILSSKHDLNDTPKFFQKSVSLDGHCLFSSLCFLLGDSTKDNIKRLRKKVADFILESDTIDDAVLFSETGKTRKQYCKEMRDTNTWGGEAEIRAIAKINGVIIRIVKSLEISSMISSVYVTEFPENEPSFKRCVYIIYLQNNHYEPLYLRNGDNSNEEITIFDRNNRTTKKLLCEFIYEKFDINCSRVEFRYKTNEDEIDFEHLAEDQSCHQSNSINEHTNKRKAPDNDDNPFMHDTTKKFASLALTTNQVVNIQSSTSSRSIPAGDQIYIDHKENELLTSIQQHLQTDIRTLNSSMCELMKQKNQSSLHILSNNTTVSHMEQMRFETKPISGFRGRLFSEFQPKSEFKRNGTKSKARPPIYFADSDNQHYLNLLIPETFLFGDLNRVRVEISIITRTINGCTYLHPYFKFYDLRRNRTSVTVNPLLIDIGSNELHKLTKYTEGMYKLQLFLTVVMLKNDELLQNQPIQLFQLSISNQQNTPTIYYHSDTYKRDFHLNDLRFAATLLIKNTDDNEYRRCVDLQCISSISTQDPKFKVSEANIS